jgi:galactofuranosylgalactofuranosylrhamnosyl-N-acetylglucosaminyl-diphospho-decaprenol beta-1,5/1,6-galactofuranosyltransferase
MARSNATPKSAGVTTLHRVVLPIEADPEVLALYIDADNWGDVAGKPVRLSDNNHIEDVLGRQKLRIRAGSEVSFASYFNAFPAAYWQRWTSIPSVTLNITTSGSGTVLLYRSNARGVIQRIDSASVSTKSKVTTFELPLTNFIDGGWYWFDLIAGTTDLTFEGAEYTTDVAPKRTGKATVAITTFNRPEYCIEVVRTLANEKGLETAVDAICVIDQGDQKVSAQPGFAAVAKKLGTRFKHINQPNLGGSGGFSRGMIEALKRKESDFVLLLDDDVIVEPEGVSRAVAFGRFTHNPTIVGGHMFDMYDRAQIHSYSEKVDRDRFFWGPKDWSQFRHNFHASNLRQTTWAHERADVDFNGWWMSLIPLDIVREIGLSLPIFIKWDDAEYSLRAKDHGFATVSFPGAAVWHVSWQDKDDYKDWQAYFHARNRAVVALLHSPHKKGGRFINHSFMMSVKHLFKMQYFTDELFAMGIDDALAGPNKLHEVMGSQLGVVRATATKYPETKVIRNSADLPEPIISVNDVPPYTPLSRGKLVLWLLKNAPRQFRPANPSLTGEQPQVSLSATQASWWALAAYDSALVSTADGSGKQHYRRDGKEFKRRLDRALKQRKALEKAWPQLSASYREALPAITSVEAWKTTIGIK